MISLETNLDNLPHILGVMVPIVAIAGGLCFAFASRYLKSKERMEMISRGMDISALRDMEALNMNRGRRSPIRRGMMFLGVGVGLLLSYWLCHTVFTGDDNTVIYFGVVFLCVGGGLLLSHMIEGKNSSEQKNP